MVRMYAVMLLCNAWIAYNGIQITEGRVRRVLIQGYAAAYSVLVFLFAWEHYNGRGIMSLRVAGTLKFVVLIVLMIAYGWFGFMQPPRVFELAV